MTGDNVAIIAAVAASAGSLLTAAVGEAIKWLHARKDSTRRERADALVEWKGVADGWRGQYEDLRHKFDASEAECRRVLGELRDDLDGERVARVRADARIEVLEDALRANNIPFRPFAPGGSGTHQPLTPGGDAP
jgi:hypothetical protein